MKENQLSIIMPARNEQQPLDFLLPEISSLFPEAEIIVVDDGSTDSTRAITEKHGATCVPHPYSLGNGAAIKTGARMARGKVLVFMDADGQHRPSDIPKLLELMAAGYDMVIGTRRGSDQAGPFRRIANSIYNRLASLIVGHPIADLTSGMRVVSAQRFREILPLLPNGFSYPTTSTMAFFRLGYRVGFTPISVFPRQGKSHIRLFHDGFRFLLIIIKIGTLYSPLKLFVPLSVATFTAGIIYYGYTFLLEGRFTNMAALLITSSVVIFLFGLLSEQITTLLYSQTSRNRDER